jgi:molybdopterin/thiamine biosynthesis adenylyltransferase
MTRRVVTVVGVGALGSHVVQFLRNVDVSLRVIDDDRVEQKNVLAQFHSKKSVGKSKVQSVSQSMQFMFGQKVDGTPHRLRADNAEEMLGGSALVIECLDNIESRQVVSEFVRAHRIPCLHGALAPDGQFGRVIWDEHFAPDAEAGAGAATCEGGEHLPFIGVVSSYVAYAAQRYLEKEHKVGFQVHPAGATPI